MTHPLDNPNKCPRRELSSGYYRIRCSRCSALRSMHARGSQAAIPRLAWDDTVGPSDEIPGGSGLQQDLPRRARGLASEVVDQVTAGIVGLDHLFDVAAVFAGEGGVDAVLEGRVGVPRLGRDAEQGVRVDDD